MQHYEPFVGQSILQALTAMLTLAQERQEAVSSTFNEIPLLVTSADTVADLVVAYHAAYEKPVCKHTDGTPP